MIVLQELERKLDLYSYRSLFLAKEFTFCGICFDRLTISRLPISSLFRTCVGLEYRVRSQATSASKRTLKAREFCGPQS